MVLTRFDKMHGLGNDFIVLDARVQPVGMTPTLAAALADRHRGIGCDQLILLGPSDTADLSMRIFNADGSEVEACGNASRCVVAREGRDVTIDTPGGLIHGRLEDAGVTMDMGRPRFEWQDIPLDYAMDGYAMPVSWGDLPAPMAVNVGNPHVVFFVDDLDTWPLAELGPLIEHDPLFPERINVNFAQIIGDRIRLIVWERGAGFTKACGTGACATAVAAIRRALVSSPVAVDLPGGTLTIDWAADRAVMMTGPATHVFSGTVDLDALA